MAENEEAGKVLLDSARCLEWLSAEDLDKLDCVLLESGRSIGTTRVAHRTVLAGASEFFAKKVAKLRLEDKRDECSSNTIKLDMSIDMIDIILEHLYTREPIKVPDKLALEAYSATSRLGIREASQQIRDYLYLNAENRLESEIFDSSIWPADVECLADVFVDLQLDETHKRRLMDRVRLWSSDDTSKSRTALRLYQKLYSVQRAVAEVETEPLIVAEDHSLSSTVAVIGKSSSTNSHTALSLSSMNTIWTGTFSAPRSDPIAGSVIIDDLLYIPSGSQVYVRRIDSNELVREVKGFNGCIGGSCVFAGQVYFHTRHKLYALNADGTGCAEVACMKENLNETSFVVLRRDADELSIAVAMYENRTVRLRTFCRGEQKRADVKLQTLPWNMAPLGCYRGLLYYCTVNGPPFYYAGFRDDMKIKYHEIVGDCYDIVDNEICDDGILYIVYVTRGNREIRHHVRAIDLNRDTVVFNRPVSELGLVDALYLIRVLGKSGNVNSGT